MSYSICKKCERFFPKNGKNYCDKCYDGMKSDGDKIKEYLELHPQASIMELVTELKVSMKNINLFLAEGGAVISTQKTPDQWLSPRQQEMKEEEEREQKLSRRSSGHSSMRSTRRSWI